MAYALAWLPSVLKAAGLQVGEVKGWEVRGRAEMGTVKGVMLHHTAGPAQGNMPSLNTLINGRPDLTGPLAQLGLARDGAWYVIAAGRANHAGEGNWQGITAGNSHFIGVECENEGRARDTWPKEQVTSLLQGTAAILKYLRLPATTCIGHREYAPSRKIDPLLDMNDVRSRIAGLLAGGVSPLAPIPAREPTVAQGQTEQRLTLRRGQHGPLVVALQKALNIQPADGLFGPHTEALVREFQRRHRLVPDGIVGPNTWGMVSRVGAS